MTTDNIKPQVPEAKAPMTTKEIIQLLGGIRAVYPVALGNALGEEETAAGMEALTAAVQAVELLEQIKEDLSGECCACKHFKRKMYEKPCAVCFDGEEESAWEFRWPLGEETDQ